MAKEGTRISVSKACELAGISRRSFYYKPKDRRPKVNESPAGRIRRVIDALPYAGYPYCGLVAG